MTLSILGAVTASAVLHPALLEPTTVGSYQHITRDNISPRSLMLSSLDGTCPTTADYQIRLLYPHSTAIDVKGCTAKSFHLILSLPGPQWEPLETNLVGIFGAASRAGHTFSHPFLPWFHSFHVHAACHARSERYKYRTVNCPFGIGPCIKVLQQDLRSSRGTSIMLGETVRTQWNGTWRYLKLQYLPQAGSFIH